MPMRYAGPPAAWLRGVKAVYFGLFANAIVIGWVVLAMSTVFRVLFPDMTVFGQTEMLGLDAPTLAVGGLMLLVGVYSLISGLWGITVTDSFQFVLAMTGSIALACAPPCVRPNWPMRCSSTTRPAPSPPGPAPRRGWVCSP